MPWIRFEPFDVRFECDDDESVFDVGRRNGVPIATACIGNGTCGLCRVKIVDGEDNLTPFNAAERRHMGNVYYLTKVRLACQACVFGGDVTVEVPPVQKT